MNKSTLDEILDRMHELQLELEAEIDALLREKRRQFRYSLKKGKVRFEYGMKALQRGRRISVWNYVKAARLGHVLTAPVIYGLIVPLLLLDILITLYQQICFRVYGIERVRRSEYIIIDRGHLAYLNAIEKLNCLYCGYANGLIEYVREIGARTEHYWCPIKHARRSPEPHRLTKEFVDYGDADAYRERLRRLRDQFNEPDAN